MSILRGEYLPSHHDAHPQSFLGRTELPSAAQDSCHKLPLVYEAGAMPVIALTILLTLIVEAVGGGSFILALFLQSLLDISAAFPLLGADGSVTALTVSAIN